MWDWSKPKESKSGGAQGTRRVDSQLEELFSLDDVAPPQTKPAPMEEKPKEKIPSKPMIGLNEFSSAKKLKSGAVDNDGLSKNAAPIPPPPPSLKGPASFIRPQNHEVKEDADKAIASKTYTNAVKGDEVPNQFSGDKAMWEIQLRQSNLPGMELAELTLAKSDESETKEQRAVFHRLRRDFLKYIGYHNINDLALLGINDEGVKMLKVGRAPENFNVHVKIPFEYNGAVDFSNLCLIQTRPFHESIHRFLDLQIAGRPDGAGIRTLFMPIPPGKVYVPEVEVSTGGGKSMADRSVYTGFLSSTFKEIAIKKMMGKSMGLD